ncbi:tRNA (N6-isopentenyl adenosine(37)-C2)-methylthiotransferase MiaB [Candidatus Falkowbacteria bacterium CG_4_10_14_0_2_um_filter_36_22]|uniref:tRNA-2-methylthio-N(6)-dimethylallyladenosine synthase n=1 Tax=Candidatus Falkowbacteria bacterium CG02_land_8_20_14_3_00_36_14 TaxID=1974560 RepID=A0A2M7DL51_9BACT|nr:MAG: tRNA (N6-isopentenyl adenosine(37)-C2)-methylthiotransferase MiaB [Candidatus Falkowbacteria bacterium CG02_land_8_20_14_3_00_36_14]PIX10981.1 MAG: tRNA (N6-isopentenyl adenosine(37)-C2)-methylthiotransferase MiaB [Candidatus Falkowbacteria bacterium CG_4_8_14_3_um_filter_36_11]PJA10158.1 MAG: tRNA (N6-isopentenyl adenosine(37)-C2)-methylthiotransferase MiaB [Candidatus Falkowbacteria bacterium CG_4_10_14_0_2_um_filter_36_22]
MKNNKYHIVTIGCQMNKSDSERIAGYLDNLGYKNVASKDLADLLVVTTCGVRQSAEDRIYGIIPRFKKHNPGKKVILTGCLSGDKGVQRRLKKHVDIWLPITELPQLAAQLKKPKKNQNSLSGYFNIMPKYNSSFSAFIPIGNGCDNFCSYCYVPYARSREVYRPADDIIKEARSLVAKGYKEIILIAQNVNSYIFSHPSSSSLLMRRGDRREEDINFPDLLRMVNNIPGDFWLRFSTNHPKDMSNELIQTAAKCEKVCEHIHLPAQSGDNDMLKKMNRKYTREHYINLINKLRREFFKRKPAEDLWKLPLAITTDIIVGFPGETEKQFNASKKLCHEVKFDMAYVSQYSPRPHTASFNMRDNVSKIEKKRRENCLMQILRRYNLENNKKYMGKTVLVLVEGKTKKREWYGKTRTAKVVKIEKANSHNLKGKFTKVKIKQAEDFGLRGEFVKSL